MASYLRSLTSGLVGVLIASANIAAQGQAPQSLPKGAPTEVTNIRINAGQAVVPYYEGWVRNADGSFDLVFGYFNRNWKEEIAIPVGPDNKFEPGNPDGGQPTYFMPRRQRWIVRYHVPSDFGKKTVTWSITANGRPEKAYGDLLPAQELTERVLMTNGSFDPGEDDPNKPPTLNVTPPQGVTAGVPVKLTASGSDDGLPKPRPVAAPPPPPPAGRGGAPIAQVNSSGGGRQVGLRMSWLQIRGPGKVTFAAPGPTMAVNGETSTNATFALPGTYVLRAFATDGQLTTRKDITVTVK